MTTLCVFTVHTDQ